MKLIEAQEIVRQVSGKGYPWLRAWGLGYIGEAVRTVESRQSATDADRELAFDIRRKLERRW